jgi:hypothetical protein
MRTKALAAGISVVALALAYWTVPVRLVAQGIGGDTAAAQAAAKVPTPHTADGHPDLTGLWNGGGNGNVNVVIDERGNVHIPLNSRETSPVNFERDSGIRQRADSNRPIYKRQFWSKVEYLDENGNAEDPTFSCMPAGVPRMGPPQKIIQLPNELIFLYQTKNTYRLIPINGKHPPADELEGTWNGDSVAYWEGDTMVIDSIGFNDFGWLGWPGYFHSEDLHVIERLRRVGNVLNYQATAEDTTVLMKPWLLNPRTLLLNTDPKGTLLEELPCAERSLQHMTTKERG